MGVFARLRRKSKRAAEKARSAAEAAEDAAANSNEAADTDADTVSGSAGVTGDGTTAAEGIDIPKQQTADEAADNEAGEGARK